MKKILALVLAFAMMFSTITVAFAEPVVGDEAKALATIGMLEGSGDGVTAEYTATELNKLTGAIMILKLKGLYADAVKYVGTNNFADVEEVKWAEGKNVLAYVKDNPVGFGGNEKGEFKPYDTLSEQMLYKVLLENLGYKQNVGEVVGDFAWAETLEFAEKLGLKPAKADKFTVDGLSKAVVAALKTNMKDGKAWINVLVDAGKVDKTKAVAAELMVEAPAKPVVEDKVAPKVLKVEATNNNQVTVTFDRDIEKASGEDVANYIFKSTTGKALVVKTAKVDGKVVVVETEGMENLRVYNATIANVKNASGLVMAAKYTGTFKGIIDKKAPLLSKVTVKNNIRINLTFNEELDKATAETVANYAIADLTVEKATLIQDNFDKYTIVELITSSQDTNKKYTVKVNNVEDKFGNALAKEASLVFYGMKAEKNLPTIDFANTKAIDGNIFIVSFKDDNRINLDTAENTANYTFNNDLAAESVEVMDKDDLDCKTVLIKTSEMTKGKSYQLKVANVEDELGNVMKQATISFAGKGEDVVPPYVKLAEAKATDKIKVTFDSYVDVASAENLDNYSISGLTIVSATLDKSDRTVVNLKTSTQESNKKYSVAIVNVADLAGNVMSKATSTVYGYNAETDATEPEVEYIQVVANDLEFNNTTDLQKTEVRVYLNKAVVVTGNPAITLAVIGTDGKASATTVNANFVGALGYTSGYDDGTAFGGYMDGGKVLQFATVAKLDHTKSYRLVAVGKSGGNNIKDFYGNTVDFTTDVDKINDLAIDAPGTTADNERAVIESIVQKDVKTIEVTFTENVRINSAPVYSGESGLTFTDVSGNATATDDARVIEIRKGSAMTLGNTVKFNFSEFIVDYSGDKVLDYEDATDGSKFSGVSEFYIALEDKENPIMIDAWAKNNATVVAKYDETIASTARGVYTLTYVNDKGVTQSVSLNTAGITKDAANDDGTYQVRIPLASGSKLESKYVYTLKASGARDIAGNVMTTSTFDFVGSDIVPNTAGITNVQVLNGSTALVYFGSGRPSITSVTEIYKDSSNDDVAWMTFAYSETQAGNQYVNNLNITELTATNAYNFFYGDGVFELVSGTQKYRFTSTLSTAGITIASNGLLTYSDMVAGDIVTVYNYETVTTTQDEIALATGETATIGADDNGLNLVVDDTDSIVNTKLENDTYYLVKVVRNGEIKYAAKVKYYK